MVYKNPLVWQEDGHLTGTILLAILEGDSSKLRVSGDDVLVVLAHSVRCGRCLDRRLRINRNRPIPTRAYEKRVFRISLERLEGAQKKAQARLDEAYPQVSSGPRRDNPWSSLSRTGY